MIHNPEVIPTEGTHFTMDGFNCPLCKQPAVLSVFFGQEGDVSTVHAICKSDGFVHWAPLGYQMAWTHVDGTTLNDRLIYQIGRLFLDETERWSGEKAQERARWILSPLGRLQREAELKKFRLSTLATSKWGEEDEEDD